MRLSTPISPTGPERVLGITEAVSGHAESQGSTHRVGVLSRVGKALFPFLYPPPQSEYTAAGFTNVHDYLFLSEEQSAKGPIISKEILSLAMVVAMMSALSLVSLRVLTGMPYVRIIALIISVFYIFVVLFKVVMMIASIREEPHEYSPDEIRAVADSDLPVMTILIPLYKEHTLIPQIFKYLSEFDYPPEKLDIIFILEETDKETAEAFLAQNPPSHFKALLSPDVQPKTKPKAMNVAFRQAKGEYIVIYDAEILPEADQLKKAYLTLKDHPDVNYLHAKFDVYNLRCNWITRLYAAELTYFYHHFMPGVVCLGFPVPISGHTVFFRRTAIEAVGAWDPYNVAEDCDIGIRLFRHGFGSGMMLESHSWEQSTATIPTWVRQRTRWVQGFIQTTLVQLRYPLLLKKQLKTWRNFCAFLLFVPGNVVQNILNIVQWCLFILWYTTSAPFIQLAYTGPTLYISMVCFVAGNFILTFFWMYGLFSRKHYWTVFWAVLTPIYWVMLGIATIRATYHLFLHPYKWDKTQHFAVQTTPPHA